MAKLIYSEQALADLERLTDFLIEADPLAATETIGLIEEAVGLLKRHPLVGHPVEHKLSELVISRGRTGYLALYSFEEDQDAVLILAYGINAKPGVGNKTRVEKRPWFPLPGGSATVDLFPLGFLPSWN